MIVKTVLIVKTDAKYKKTIVTTVKTIPIVKTVPIVKTDVSVDCSDREV